MKPQTYKEIELARVDEDIANLKLAIQQLESDRREIQLRQTGRSTAIALKTISEALSTPNTPIAFRDHHDSKLSNKCLADLILMIIADLELQNLFCSHANLTLYYKL